MFVDSRDFRVLLRYIEEAVIQPLRKYLGLRKKPLKSLRFISKNELKDASSYVVKEIASAEPGRSFGPHVLGESPQVENVILPPVRLYEIKNTDCSISHAAFLVNGVLWYETIEGVEVERCDYTGTMLLCYGHRLSLIDYKVESVIHRGILLGGSGAANYYHWMIEILPKLRYIKQLGFDYDDYPLLVSKSVLKFESFKDALNCLVRDREVIFLDDELVYNIGSVLHISPPSIFPYNLRPKECLKPEDHFFRKSAIEFVRDGVIAGLGVEKSEGSERLFFARRSKRRNYNEDEIFELFEAAGFRKVYMAELTLKEQIEHMRSAEHIAGPTGAEWTNLLFCNAGTKAICWMNAALSGFSCFSNLAHDAGVELKYICFPSKVTTTKSIYSETYELSKEVVSDALNKLGFFE